MVFGQNLKISILAKHDIIRNGIKRKPNGTNFSSIALSIEEL